MTDYKNVGQPPTGDTKNFITIGGKKIYYNLKENNNIDMNIIVQKLINISIDLYNSSDDMAVNKSYELNHVIDDLIEIQA